MTIGCNINLKAEIWIWVIPKEIIILSNFSHFSFLLFRKVIYCFFLSLKASAPVHVIEEALLHSYSQDPEMLLWHEVHSDYLNIPASLITCVCLLVQTCNSAALTVSSLFSTEKQEISDTTPCRKLQEERDSNSFLLTQSEESYFPQNFRFLFWWEREKLHARVHDI